MIGTARWCVATVLSVLAPASAATPTTAPATRPAVEVTAYVPGTTAEVRGDFGIVLEVANHTDRPIQVGDHPVLGKVFQAEVRPFSPPARLPAPRGDQPLVLYPKVRTVYPNIVELLGVDITGRIDPRFTVCQPGQAVLVKVRVRGIFQPGNCQLLVSLLGPSPAVGSGPEVARAQPIDLEVVSGQPK